MNTAARVDIGSEAWRFVCVWLVSTLLLFTDVFGIGDAQRRISQDLFYDVTAVSLEAPFKPPIVTLLATDGDLANLQASWPLSHAIQAEVLAEVAAYEPSAIFIDILFLDIRDQSESDQLLEVLGEFGAPVFVASPQDGVAAPPPPSSLAFYAEAERKGVSIVDARYAQVDGTSVVMPGDAGHPLPAGVALRDVYCEVSECAEFGGRRAKPTELAWRGTPADCDRATADASERCAAITQSWILRLAKRFAAGVFPSFANEPLVNQGLLPFETITLSDVLLADDPGANLTNAIVFYGQSFRAASDVADTPVYGPVPGVMAHAAHFDDLVSRGDRKFVPERPFGLSSLLYEASLIGFLCLVMTATRLALQSSGGPLIKDSKGELSESRLHSLTAIAVGLAAFAVLASEVMLFRTTPEHWLVAFGVIALDSYVPWVRIRDEITTRLAALGRFFRNLRGA